MKNIFIFALSIVIVLLSVQNCQKTDIITSQDEAIAMFQKDEQFFINELDSLGRHIATQEVIIVQYEDRIQAILQENSGLKKQVKILSQEKISLAVKLDSLIVPVDSSTISINQDCKNGYSYGTEFKVSTEFFSIKVKLQPYGVTIPSLYIPVDVVATHYVDGTFSVFSKNPYVDISSVNSIIVEQPKKKKINTFWLGYSLGVGSAVIVIGGIGALTYLLVK